MLKLTLICLLVLCLTTGCRSRSTFSWSQLTVTPTPGSEDMQSEAGESAALTLSMPVNSGVLNPLTNPSEGMQELFSLCYESVMRLNDQNQPENWLAERVESLEDGYRVTLRTQVLFHDGTGLTANAVVKSYKEIKASKDSPWKDTIAGITEMKVESERVFTLKSELGYAALFCLTFPVTSHQEENEFPAGTGPYMVTSYEQGQSMELSRFERWWRTPAQIPAIHCIALEDENSELNTFLNGTLDVCGVNMLTVSSLSRRSGVSRQEYSTGRAELLLPNLNGELGELKLRQALAQVIDRSDLISNTYQNHGVSVEVPVVPDSWLAELAEGLSYDIEAANATLYELGWEDIDGDGYLEKKPETTEEAEETPDEPEKPEEDEEDALSGIVGEKDRDNSTDEEELTLNILTNEEETSSHKEAAARLAEQFKTVGVRVNVTTVPFDELQKEIDKGEYDLLLVSFYLPDDGNLSSLLSTEGENNVMGYSSQVMDEALAALTTAGDADVYYTAMQKVYSCILDELPVYTLCVRTATAIYGGDVSFIGTPRQGQPFRGIEQWTNIK